MRYMKTSAITIRLDPDLELLVARMAKCTGRSRSEVVRDAVRRQLALTQFEDLRHRIMPLAEARGYLTDEDIFRDVRQSRGRQQNSTVPERNLADFAL
jgi:predicted transcriptional regulator